MKHGTWPNRPGRPDLIELVESKSCNVHRSRNITWRLQETSEYSDKHSYAKHPEWQFIHDHGCYAPLLFVIVDPVVHDRVLYKCVNSLQDPLAKL